MFINNEWIITHISLRSGDREPNASKKSNERLPASQQEFSNFARSWNDVDQCLRIWKLQFHGNWRWNWKGASHLMRRITEVGDQHFLHWYVCYLERRNRLIKYYNWRGWLTVCDQWWLISIRKCFMRQIAHTFVFTYVCISAPSHSVYFGCIRYIVYVFFSSKLYTFADADDVQLYI